MDNAIRLYDAGINNDKKTVKNEQKAGIWLEQIIEHVKKRYPLEGCTFTTVFGHEGGRNRIFIVSREGIKQYVLRISDIGDRCETDYLGETEFVRFLAENGAPVADVITSVYGRLVECVEAAGETLYVSLFGYAKGMLLADNGYRYREGAPLSEYFYNTGKALGAIHRLSKLYTPVHPRHDYFDKYSMEYINRLIPDGYSDLKMAIAERMEAFRALPTDIGCYGMVHFDFSDGNYHIDMDTGAITVFDFDNCLNCWYMFDLANLWIHNEGWTRQELDPNKRFTLMQQCFDLQLQGYRSETDIPEEMLKKLPLFIDMVLIENIVDEFECCEREGDNTGDLVHLEKLMTLETVCLLSNRKPDSYVHLNLKMEDYYRIKDAQKEQEKK